MSTFLSVLDFQQKISTPVSNLWKVWYKRWGGIKDQIIIYQFPDSYTVNLGHRGGVVTREKEKEKCILCFTVNAIKAFVPPIGVLAANLHKQPVLLHLLLSCGPWNYFESFKAAVWQIKRLALVLSFSTNRIWIRHKRQINYLLLSWDHGHADEEQGNKFINSV